MHFCITADALNILFLKKLPVQNLQASGICFTFSKRLVGLLRSQMHSGRQLHAPASLSPGKKPLAFTH